MGKIKIKKIDEDARIEIAHKGDAGIDLFAAEEITLYPNEPTKVRTGIAVEIPDGYVGFVKERSGLALHNIDVKAGVVDSTYRGEVIVVLRNMSKGTVTIKKHDPIAQLVILPFLDPKIEFVDELSKTERGKRGFTSRLLGRKS